MSADFVSMIHGWIEAFAVSVLSTLTAPAQMGSILYWPYLLTSLALAVLVFTLARHGVGKNYLSGFRKAYFTKAVWWHKSAQADYRFYIFNTILYPAIVGPLVVSAALLAGPFGELLSQWFGARPALQPGLGLTLLYSVIFFVAYDFGRFVAHYIQHRFEALWQFHKVHHSAEVLTPITSFRLHPVDLFLMHSIPGLATGLIQGGFDFATGGGASYYTFFGLHIGIAAYNFIGNLRHTHVWLSYGRLNNWLICPAMHQIHHSAIPKHYGYNVGYAFTIWDRLFGTHYPTMEYEEFPMGLGEGNDHEYHGVWAMYWRPVKDFAAYLGGRRGGVGYSDGGDG